VFIGAGGSTGWAQRLPPPDGVGLATTVDAEDGAFGALLHITGPLHDNIANATTTTSNTTRETESQ